MGSRPDIDLYASYHCHKGYATPVLKHKHAARFDREFWSPLQCRNDMAMLEIGCGTGLFLAYLAGRGVREFVGIDRDANLEPFLPAAAAGHFEAVDAITFLERPGPAFDRVALFDVLEHFSVEDGLHLLTALRPRMAPLGRVLVKVPNAGSPWGLQFQFGDLTHQAAFTPTSLRQLAGAAGWRCPSVYPHRLGSPVRHLMDRALHALLSRMVMTPPEIWSANFFAVLEAE
ncbi:MAG: class I SAM-dependent methyltransferase [Alphaproteobacteria bacterium]